MRVLVIGQGLAGTLVSHFALERSWDVHVIDAGLPSASAVAAGMFNPMSFRRIVPVWEAEAHLSVMLQTYQAIERILGVTLLHHLPIHKVLPNAEYASLWNDKRSTIPWLEPRQSEHDKTGIVSGGGWLNLPLLIQEWRLRLTTEGRFEGRLSNTNDLPKSQGGPWDAVVDCRGIGIHTPSDLVPLDIRKNRGELLTISCPEDSVGPPAEAVLNFGKWTIPIGQGKWRLGASYEWNRDDYDPTPATQAFLIDALTSQTPAIGPISVEDHLVGMRPVSKDRRPAVGPYPGAAGRYVLNGLGTRGVLIGPRWAQKLTHIMAGTSQTCPETEPLRLTLS